MGFSIMIKKREKMMFQKGERVKLLDKTCGNIKGLRNTLTREYMDQLELIPKYGVVVSFEKSFNYGWYYNVQVDNYRSGIFRHKNLMFYEDDLIRDLNTKWLEDDLFTI